MLLFSYHATSVSSTLSERASSIAPPFRLATNHCDARRKLLQPNRTHYSCQSTSFPFRLPSRPRGTQGQRGARRMRAPYQYVLASTPFLPSNLPSHHLLQANADCSVISMTDRRCYRLRAAMLLSLMILLQIQISSASPFTRDHRSVQPGEATKIHRYVAAPAEETSLLDAPSNLPQEEQPWIPEALVWQISDGQVQAPGPGSLSTDSEPSDSHRTGAFGPAQWSPDCYDSEPLETQTQARTVAEPGPDRTSTQEAPFGFVTLTKTVAATETTTQSPLRSGVKSGSTTTIALPSPVYGPAAKESPNFASENPSYGTAAQTDPDSEGQSPAAADVSQSSGVSHYHSTTEQSPSPLEASPVDSPPAESLLFPGGPPTGSSCLVGSTSSQDSSQAGVVTSSRAVSTEAPTTSTVTVGTATIETTAEIPVAQPARRSTSTASSSSETTVAQASSGQVSLSQVPSTEPVPTQAPQPETSPTETATSTTGSSAEEFITSVPESSLTSLSTSEVQTAEATPPSGTSGVRTFPYIPT